MTPRTIFLIWIIILYGLPGKAQTLTVTQYIDTFKNIAMQEMIDFKIPASITLAQGLLESGSGNSRLAKTGNNHFGIKCKKDWTGCIILEDDDALKECFRCYSDAVESYRDHSRFLSQNKRYSALFELEITDYKAWARGLMNSGYATNNKYADLLVSTIERNKLASYDTMVMRGYHPYDQKVSPNIEIVSNKVPSTIVQPNQTIGTIATVNHKTEKKLYKYNDLTYHRHIQPGDVIYLRPKKRKASVSTHQVSEGDNMWLISQKYAIKINSLYKKNLMETGTEPLPGAVLQLQRKAEFMPDTGRYLKPKGMSNPVNQIYHIVSKGETLYSLSKSYNISVEELISINKLKTDQLFVGQHLTLKIEESSLNVLIHIVRSGETLYSIALLYKVTVPELKSCNMLSNDSLSVGQILKIRKK